MARLVLRPSILRKISPLAACALACACLQTPIAMAQRPGRPAGGGAHPIGSPRAVPPPRVVMPPRVVLPPAPHTTVPQPRMITSPRLTTLGPRFGLRPGVNNLFRVRRRFFFGAPFFRFGPGWGFNSLWWPNCGPYWGWGYDCAALSFYGYGYGYGFENYVTLQPYEVPVYVYAPEERELVWLYLKDGTVYSVSDYWFVNGQVHFIAVEEGGATFVERTIPFDDLDVQKTADINTKRGFRVVMRDEPLEQYMRDHPDLTPPLLLPPPRN